MLSRNERFDNGLISRDGDETQSRASHLSGAAKPISTGRKIDGANANPVSAPVSADNSGIMMPTAKTGSMVGEGVVAMMVTAIGAEP